MFVIRPIAENDLDGLIQLAEQATYGLSTLPRDPDHLAGRIAASIAGFGNIEDAAPRGQTYLFAMHDTGTGQVVGCSGIASKVGGFEPFYAYRIETKVHESTVLNVRKEIQALHLVAEHNGPSEIGSLYLHPDHRGAGNGRALSLSRFLFITDHRPYFDDEIIAEMRGVIDPNGHSPFWDALGHKFFDIDFPFADYLSVVNKQFIADLMPRHPIYVTMLPDDAQAVIGQVHPNTAPALALLESEGFQRTGMVDIFEAGPVVMCPRDEIRCVTHAMRCPVSDLTAPSADAPIHLISNGQRDVRICAATIQVNGNESVAIPPDVAEHLMINVGDRITHIPLRPSQT